MGKKDFTSSMAHAAGITHLQAQKAYAALLGSVKESLKTGRKVNLSGFGSFEIKVREARQGETPRPETDRHPPQEADQVHAQPPVQVQSLGFRRPRGGRAAGPRPGLPMDKRPAPLK